jgi:peptidoglycan hydrolase-like amidase
MKKAAAILLIILSSLFFLTQVRADSIDDKINQVRKDLETLNNDLRGKEANYQKLGTQLQNIKNQIVFLEAEIVKKEKEVIDGEKVLEYQKQLLNERAKTYYKNIGKNSSSLINLFVTENISRSLENFFYQKSMVDEDKKTIIKIVLYIKNLEEKKASLENERVQMTALKKEIDRQSQILAGEISTTRQKIAQLSAVQQQLIAQKQASLNIPKSAGTGASGCVDDRDKDPGFSPRFAFFTYGVPNRVGLNQYGAYGRSKSGQNVEDILRAYYNNFELKKDYNQDITINVEGGPSLKIEEYLKHLGEMPESWGNSGGFEALKAQAVAARSYALAYTNNGSGSICGTDRCQVFLANEKGGKWNEAVEATKGWVMVQNGNPIKAWYSSTHGGYIFSSGEIGWSGTDWTKHGTDTSSGVNSFDDLRNNSYDRESPWFYCDWGYRPEYNKTAWLKPNEVADIANIILLVKRDSSTSEHLYQTDRSNPAGKDTWDAEKVKSELRARGGNPYNNVSDVSVSADFGSGRASSVNVNGDAGSNSFNASEFKDWFNLRAPANIQIVGPLFNVEKR